MSLSSSINVFLGKSTPYTFILILLALFLCLPSRILKLNMLVLIYIDGFHNICWLFEPGQRQCRQQCCRPGSGSSRPSSTSKTASSGSSSNASSSAASCASKKCDKECLLWDLSASVDNVKVKVENDCCGPTCLPRSTRFSRLPL